MEIVYRRRGVVEFCPKKEYLARVIEQFRCLSRIEEMSHDRLFANVVDALKKNITLVSGDARRITFQYSLESRKHHRGEGYMLSRNGHLLKISGKKRQDSQDVFLEPEPMVDVPALDLLTPDDLLEGINLISIQEILEL